MMFKAETPTTNPFERFVKMFKEMGIPDDQCEKCVELVTEGKFSIPTAILENKPLGVKCQPIIETPKAQELVDYFLNEIHNPAFKEIQHVSI